MKTHRTAFLCTLKPECVAEYRRHHDNVPAELEAAYRDAGILSVSCFLAGTQLLVVSEFDSERFAQQKENLMKSEVEQRWGTLMAPLRDATVPQVDFSEVYRQERRQ